MITYTSSRLEASRHYSFR